MPLSRSSELLMLLSWFIAPNQEPVLLVSLVVADLGTDILALKSLSSKSYSHLFTSVSVLGLVWFCFFSWKVLFLKKKKKRLIYLGK